MNAYQSKASSDVLYIVDQLPGTVFAVDATSTLTEQGYFPSYNIPFIPEAYNISGAAAMAQTHGSDFSYSECPRAQIFRRNNTDVHNYEDFKLLMRYNNYETDPLSKGIINYNSTTRCLRLNISKLCN
jgi:hypothetical protein